MLLRRIRREISRILAGRVGEELNKSELCPNRSKMEDGAGRFSTVYYHVERTGR